MLCHTAAYSAPYMSIFFFLFSNCILFVVFFLLHLSSVFIFSLLLSPMFNIFWLLVRVFLHLCSFISFSSPLCSTLTVQKSLHSFIHSLLFFLFDFASPYFFFFSVLEWGSFLFSFSAHLIISSTSAIIPRFLNFCCLFVICCCIYFSSILFNLLLPLMCLAYCPITILPPSLHHSLSHFMSLYSPCFLSLKPSLSCFSASTIIPPNSLNFQHLLVFFIFSCSFVSISQHPHPPSPLYPLIFSLHIYAPAQGFWKRK